LSKGPSGKGAQQIGSAITKIPVRNSVRIRKRLRRTPEAEGLHVYFEYFDGQMGVPAVHSGLSLVALRST
jgi:hypothetical protein